MGCDIYSAVEVRVCDKWVPAHPFNDDGGGYLDPSVEPLSRRDYGLFAMLAGVRFHDDTQQAIPERGIPGDASDDVSAWLRQWASDGHSASHATLDELLRIDWGRRYRRSGVLSLADFRKWSRWYRGKGEAPASWCGSISGPGIQTITEAEALALSDSETSDRIYVACEWWQTACQLAGELTSRAIPMMLHEAHANAERTYGDVRLVYFFDN